ncbi:AAA-like domain-containing protein [Nostoc sp. C110]|uniref:AAA-like domain-containing protein n=1 Tax=Nostoc sp. C110 TaxID=3349876 RepID=UPI00370DB440
MKREEFNQRLEQLTRYQKPVLKGFLEGKTDLEISSETKIEPGTVRKHLSNICKIFGLNNGEGEHYSYRSELIELFINFPHKDYEVAPELRDRFSLRKPEPEFPGRPVALDSPFYIPHTLIQEQCDKEILKPSSLVRIKASKKIGKTSLLRRILATGEKQGYKTVYIDLRKEADRGKLNDLDRFLRWFCATVSRKLELSSQLDDWDSDSELYGSKQCCFDYFQKLLEQLDVPLILAIDEIDVLFPYPQTAEEFFALLRACFEEQNDPETWGKLRQAIAYSTDLYIKIDINQSPFNVGLPVPLPKFTAGQVQQLAQCYGLKWAVDGEVKSLIQLVGGHPHLIQLALYHLYKEEMTLKDLLNTAATFDGIYRNHLQHLWDYLQESATPTATNQPTILIALKQVISSQGSVKLEPEASYQLQGLGLVEFEQNQVKISCELYQNYFKERLL